MPTLTFGMNLSVDGYIAAPGDDLGWSVPSDELFQWWSDGRRRRHPRRGGHAGRADRRVRDRHPPGPGGRRHSVLHGPGQLGEPEPGGDPDVSRRRAPDQVRDQALNTRPRIAEARAT